MALANLLAMPPRRQPAAPTGMTPSRQVLAQRVPRSEALVRALMEGGTKSEPIETGLELIGKLAQVWGSERGQRKRDEYDREQTGRAASDMAAALAGYGSFPTMADIEAQRPRSGGDIPPMDIRPPGASVPGGTQLPKPQQGAAGWQPDMDPDVTGWTPGTQPTALWDDRGRTAGVSPDLLAIVTRAAEISPIQFRVGESGGRRDEATQRDLVARGASQTMNSRHLTGSALDLIPVRPDGQADPNWVEGYDQIASAMRQAAQEMGVTGLEWGGDWKSFVDRPHWQYGEGTPGAAPSTAGGGYMFQEPPRDSTGGAVYPQPTGGPNTQGIMAALASPYLPEVYQQVGSQLLSQAMTPPDPTADLQEINGQLVNVRTGEVVGDYRDQPAAPETDADIREFQQAQQLGLVPPGTTYQQYLEMKRAPGTTVDVNIPGAPTIGTVPQGWAASQDPVTGEWSMKPIAGGPAEVEAAEAAAEAANRGALQAQTTDIVTQDIDRALSIINQGTTLTTGIGGGLLGGVPGTPAFNLNALIDTIRANVGFDKLQAMRMASPTGGALGAVSERENALLQSTLGNLANTQDPRQLRDNLNRVYNVYLDIVHGPGQGPERRPLSFEQQGPSPLFSPEPSGPLSTFQPQGGLPAAMTPQPAPMQPPAGAAIPAAPTHIWTPDGGLRPVQ